MIAVPSRTCLNRQELALIALRAAATVSWFDSIREFRLGHFLRLLITLTLILDGHQSLCRNAPSHIQVFLSDILQALQNQGECFCQVRVMGFRTVL